MGGVWGTQLVLGKALGEEWQEMKLEIRGKARWEEVCMLILPLPLSDLDEVTSTHRIILFSVLRRRKDKPSAC